MSNEWVIMRIIKGDNKNNMVKKVEITMDMNERINQILNKKDVVAMNCDISSQGAGLLFEKSQKNAGLIKDLTWDVEFSDGTPVIKRKDVTSGNNFNYVVFKVTFADDEEAQSYISDGGEKLIKTLNKNRLGTYQTLAYKDENSIYIMFNMVDNKGRKFGKKEDLRLIRAFAD